MDVFVGTSGLGGRGRRKRFTSGADETLGFRCGKMIVFDPFGQADLPGWLQLSERVEATFCRRCSAHAADAFLDLGIHVSASAISLETSPAALPVATATSVTDIP